MSEGLPQILQAIDDFVPQKIELTAKKLMMEIIQDCQKQTKATALRVFVDVRIGAPPESIEALKIYQKRLAEILNKANMEMIDLVEVKKPITSASL